MRVVNLTHGVGNGVDSACLMTASNMLIGKGGDGDRNSCVCPVIRAFIVPTNDKMPTPLLGTIYGPLVWEILGTKATGSVEHVQSVERKRAYYFADVAVRRILPLVVGGETAKQLRSMPGVIDAPSALVAANATYGISPAAAAASTAAASTASITAAASTASVVRTAASVVGDAGAKVWELCPTIIREAAMIGDQRPKEPKYVISHDQLCDALD